MERQRIGQSAEDAAVGFLESQGLTIVLRNFRRRLGELDIVAREGAVIVVVEVRTRSSERFGGAAASVDARKRSKLLRAAAQLLQQRKDLAKCKVRFDVIVVHRPASRHVQVEWIKHAFAA
jgi:putative endonuclease